MPARATRRPAARRKTARRSTRTGRAASTARHGSIQNEIDRDLRAWIRRHGKAGVMPSRGQLIRSGSAPLASRIHHHGGSAAVARRNRLRVAARRR